MKVESKYAWNIDSYVNTIYFLRQIAQISEKYMSAPSCSELPLDLPTEKEDNQLKTRRNLSNLLQVNNFF